MVLQVPRANPDKMDAEFAIPFKASDTNRASGMINLFQVVCDGISATNTASSWVAVPIHTH